VAFLLFLKRSPGRGMSKASLSRCSLVYYIGVDYWGMRYMGVGGVKDLGFGGWEWGACIRAFGRWCVILQWLRGCVGVGYGRCVLGGVGCAGCLYAGLDWDSGLVGMWLTMACDGSNG
jgi:hypothetical protein